MFVKLQNGVLKQAPKKINHDDKVIFNPTEEILKELGYKQLVKDENIVENAYIVSTTYTEDDNNIYEHNEWKTYEDAQKEQESYEKTRLFTSEEAMQVVIKAQINTLNIDDNTSLRMLNYYPDWNDLINQKAEKDFKFTYNGKLYKVLQEHTFSSAWVPNSGTESLYSRIDEEHEGDIYDPIPYEKNMVLELGKYYIQNGIVYKCIQKLENSVWDLKDIPAFVEKVG